MTETNSLHLGLAFKNEVEQQFGFLQKYGYQCTMSGPSNVRFESVGVMIDLLFDPTRSFELTLLISRRNSEAAFTIGELLQAASAPEAKDFRLIQVDTEEAIRNWIGRLKDKLLMYGHGFILGDSNCFFEIEKLRDENVREYALQRDLNFRRGLADAAWVARDYPAVVDAYDSVRAHLTEAEVRKLDYSKGKMASS